VIDVSDDGDVANGRTQKESFLINCVYLQFTTIGGNDIGAQVSET
jgi:hypothetical protein